MSENATIQIRPCIKEQIPIIMEGINSYNLSKVPALGAVWTPLEFVATNAQQNVIGGILAGVGYWNGLEINILWVAQEYRHQGIGSQLLEHAEKKAKALGATMAMLDTFDFQAEAFYLKHHYNVIGTLDNFPQDQKRIYMSKPL